MADTSTWRWPVLEGIRPFDKSRLLPDLMAGVTLAALGIPEVMGYTKIIGTPVITGLYTILLPMFAFSLFGSSRHLVVGADSATAAVVAAGLVSLASPYAPKYVALTSLVALVAGGFLLLARVLRLGFLADFLSRTALIGFLTGVGVQVALGQVHAILGLEKSGHGSFEQLLNTFQHLGQTHWASLGIAVVVLGVTVCFDAVAPRFPGALLAVIGMIAASAWFHWGDHGLRLVGKVESGLPRFGFPGVTFQDAFLVLSVSASSFILILAQSAATSRAYAMRYNDHFDENVDLVGLAFANFAAGMSSTFVVNGSPTKTAIADTAGARSQVCQLTTVAIVLLALFFLTKPLSYMPEAALAAIVFLIGLKLIDLRGLSDIFHKSRGEFVLGLLIATTVIFFGVTQGILFALVISLLYHVRHNYSPYAGILLRDPDDHWRMIPFSAEARTEPGLVVYWFGSDLFYANIHQFVRQLDILVLNPKLPLRWLVVDAGAITHIDYTAGKVFPEILRTLKERGISLMFVHVSASLLASLDKQKLTTQIGHSHLFGSLRDCLAAYHAETRRG